MLNDKRYTVTLEPSKFYQGITFYALRLCGKLIGLYNTELEAYRHAKHLIAEDKQRATKYNDGGPKW